ncbi:MAG: hypothetical protein FWC32_01455 [Firmicutes bacterium]|nr:hypothetical protein [Bacillota bacterium]
MIIQKLLLLESEAQEAMRALEKEQALSAKKAEEDLSRRIAELEWEKDATIQKLEQSTEDETAEIIAIIEAEYKQKGSELITAFAANRDTWKGKIVQDVLYGDL